MPPIVSIIIPCFNAEKDIKTAIESALAQTYPQCEVIVVDDGSTDDSVAIIRSFGARVRLEIQSHQGASAARNRGLALSSGEHIQFLDADDVLHTEKVSRQMALMPQAGNAIVYCDYNIVLTDGSDAIIARLSPLKEDDPVCLALTRPIQTSSPLHRREWLNRVGGFNEERPCSQEFELHLRLACQGAQFYHLPEVLFDVRKREGSISDDYVRVLDQFESILTAQYKYLEDEGRLSELYQRRFAEAMCSAAVKYVRLGEMDKAKKYYGLAEEMHAGGGLTQYRSPIRWVHRLLGPLRARRWLESMKG